MQQARATLIEHPFDIVVFGGKGDLAKRKLIPALFHLDVENRLPPDGRIIAVSRAKMDRDTYRQQMHDGCVDCDFGHFDKDAWGKFAERLDYVASDATHKEDYGALKQALSGRDEVVRVFYLATAPDLFVPIAENLSAAGLITPLSRLVLEKPIGHDLESAHAINAAIGRCLSEQQIFRIDHYLGKETVQNLMVLRFANGLFEPLWNRTHIDHIQITVAETVGVGGRWA